MAAGHIIKIMSTWFYTDMKMGACFPEWTVNQIDHVLVESKYKNSIK